MTWTQLELDIVSDFANFCDMGRLYELEFQGKLPRGAGHIGLFGGLRYLIRIVQLRNKFKDGSYPGPTVIK